MIRIVYRTWSRPMLLPLLLCTMAWAGQDVFREISAESGLAFTHYNGMTGEYLLPEIMGAGVALFDYDNDGDLDVYLVQGATYPKGAKKPPLHPFKGTPSDRLFRNDLAQGIVRFTDVTEKAGLRRTGFGMGVACGDFDNDGDVDLYVTNLGGNTLWRNKGDGTFEDHTAASGTDDGALSTSAIFADLDADGLLDLFVVNYMPLMPDGGPKCYAANSSLDYCGPNAFPDQRDRFFRNLGNGTFEDRSQLLAGAAAASGLGVDVIDADGDGLLDLYVANDGDANHLWRNKGDGTFVEDALFSGIALNGEGVPEAGMGITVGDVDGDGDEDLFLTHLEKETNTLYLNDGGFFDDGSAQSGLGLPSMPYTGFGTRFFDLENDGSLDLLVLNGAVRTMLDQVAKNDPYPLKQANQLYLNNGKGRFRDASAKAGPGLLALEVSRGAALGDLNNDGAADLVLTNNLGPARVFLNTAARSNHWLGVSVRDLSGKRHGLGALVTLELSDGTRLIRRVNRGGSYLSAHDPRLIFGMGTKQSYKRLEVLWPGGKKRTLTSGPIDRYITISREEP